MKDRWRSATAAVLVAFIAVLACGVSATRAAPRARRSSGAPAMQADSALARALLDAHNAARARARPSPSPRLPRLEWDPALAEVAQRWANRCPSGHNLRSPYGENLYFSSEAEVDAERAVSGWASEAEYYDYRTGECVKDGSHSWAHCGHYTQLVWRDTTRVGCGVRTDCRGQFRTVVVCNYDPPGNVNVGDSSIPHPY